MFSITRQQDPSVGTGKSSIHDRADLKVAAGCAATVAALILLTWPFGGLSFDDDFSYTFTAKHLADTGKIAYGWTSAALVPQAYWGALFIKLFGFSFTVVRLCMLPVASACGAMSYLLARRCGLRPGLALLSAMTIIASPIFITLSASFMTDVSGLLFTLVALHCVVSASTGDSAASQRAWVVGAVASTLFGGLIRQSVWAAGLAGLPWVVWSFRRNRSLAAFSLFGFAVLIVGIVATMLWLSRQPFVIPEYPFSLIIHHVIHKPADFMLDSVGLIFTFALFNAPILLVFVAKRRAKVRQYCIAAAVIMLLMLARVYWNGGLVAPWIGNVLTRIGPMGLFELGAGRPPVLPGTVWILVSIAVYLLLTASLAKSLTIFNDDAHPFYHSLASVIRSVRPNSIIVSFTLLYIALILPRCAVSSGFDRYLLPLLPCIGILILLKYQSAEQNGPIKKSLMIAPWTLVATFALFGVITTNELLALGRARVAAADLLQKAGIPREAIDDGFEFDYWTQLLDWGYINDPRITNPPGAYKPQYANSPLPKCPAFNPRYRVRFEGADLAAGERLAGFPPVTYFTLAPPFHRTLRIYQLSGSGD